MHFVFLPHSEQMGGIDKPDEDQRFVANPPMIESGVKKILSLLPDIKALGPYALGRSSRSMRACDTMSIVAMELGLDFTTSELLTVYANFDKKSGRSVPYPGHENDDFDLWQQNGRKFINSAFLTNLMNSGGVLATCHRPIVAGIVGHTRDIHDVAGLEKLAHDPTLFPKGYLVVETNDGENLRLVE